MPTAATSTAPMNAGQRPLTSRADPRPAAEEWKRRCALALGSAVAYDQAAGDGWCQHLHYVDLMADSIAAVRGLYQRVGERLSDLHVRRMEAFLECRPQDVFGHHRYDPADFGWTYAGLSEEFAEYRSRYRVAPEVH